MKYVGIDLHKKTISACVVIKERGKRKVAARKRLECQDEASIAAWFAATRRRSISISVGKPAR